MANKFDVQNADGTPVEGYYVVFKIDENHPAEIAAGLEYVKQVLSNGMRGDVEFAKELLDECLDATEKLAVKAAMRRHEYFSGL